MNNKSVEERLSHFPYEPNTVQWAAVFDESPIGIVFCAKDGTILKANNSFCGIVEYAENELQKKTFKDITHPDDLSYDIGMLEQCLRKEIPGYEMYKRYLTKTGKVVWVRLTVWSLINDDGELVNFCAHAQRMINGEKTKLEKQDNTLIYRPQVTLRDFIADNIKAFVVVCSIAVSSFTGMGVAYWGAISEVGSIKQQQDEQQKLLFKLYDILNKMGVSDNE